MFGTVMFPTNRYVGLRREIDRLFDGCGMRISRASCTQASAYPAFNVWDAGDALCVEAEVPGVAMDDLEILTTGNELTVKGKRKPLEAGERTYHRRERSVHEFTRTITLPTEVATDKVEALLNNGVLTLRLPKADAVKPRRITVKSA